VAEVAQILALYWFALAGLGVWLYRMGSDLERKIGERRREA